MSSKRNSVKQNVAESRALRAKMDRSGKKVVNSLRQAAQSRRITPRSPGAR